MKKIIFFLMIFSLSFLCFAETIQFKSGKIIKGEIVEETEKYIKVDSNLGIPITYYLSEIESLGGSSVASKQYAEKVISYKVSKKFYLKARNEMQGLKFCMQLPQKKMLNQKNTNIHFYPKSNSFIKTESRADVPVYYMGVVKGNETYVMSIDYLVSFYQGPKTIDPSRCKQYSDLDKDMQLYLGSEGDIDVENFLIQKKVKSLIGSIKNPYKKAKALYDFIVNNFRYDRELAQTIMTGGSYKSSYPMETLQKKTGICYGLAKLYVAMTRTAGVPSRVVRGIAFEPKDDVKQYVQEIGHAWTEIYLPKYGWLSVDPTFGLSRKNDFFCFDNTSHIAEEYGLVQTQEFGSLEKGWALQARVRRGATRLPLDFNQKIIIEVVEKDE